MGTYEDRAKLIWSLAGAGLSTTISAGGNSGAWGDTATDPFPSSVVRLSPATDFQLMVYIAGKTSSPTFAVSLGYYDSLGNLFTSTALSTGTISVTTVPATAVVNFGTRAGSGGSNVYFVLPQYGQVSWTCSGGSVTGVNIELWGR